MFGWAEQSTAECHREQHRGGGLLRRASEREEEEVEKGERERKGIIYNAILINKLFIINQFFSKKIVRYRLLFILIF